MKQYLLFTNSLLLVFALALTACATDTASTQIPARTSAPVLARPSATAVPRATATPTATLLPSVTATPDTRLPPERWREWPVAPESISAHMLEVYELGLSLGRRTDRFSKIGDCQNVDSYFLSSFDNPNDYSLGLPNEYLLPTIEQFSGSWSRTSVAVAGGMNVASVVSPIWADPEKCEKGEHPLACEIRLNNPSIVFISMETWWGQKPAETYETYLRQIVEYTLAQGVVPILATKADNLEGNHSINEAVARVSYDYQVPMWNFWLAVQPLPNHGLTEDGFHLTFSRNFFDDPVRMENAWPWRNLSALQAIDSVYRGLSSSVGPVATVTPTPTVPPTPTPDTWGRRPVLPSGLSARMIEVFEKGVALGNNPRAFSKIGDGNAASDWFLTEFDRGGSAYALGQYANLQATIDYFTGSFGRRSLAARAGFNTTRVLDPARADNALCEAGESPLECELRLHRPSFAMILLGTNQAWEPEVFEAEMRLILDTLIERGVVPVLVTKADNLEGDGRINEIIGDLADEYQAPLLNFWAAIQPLPKQGLQADREHLTWAGTNFADPQTMKYGWPWRNLTALQVLDVLHQVTSK